MCGSLEVLTTCFQQAHAFKKWSVSGTAQVRGMLWGQIEELRGARESALAQAHVMCSTHVLAGCSVKTMGIIQTQSLDHNVDGQDQRVQASEHVW